MNAMQRLIGTRNAVSIATLMMLVASLLAVGPTVDVAEAAPTVQYRAIDTRGGAMPGDGSVRCFRAASDQQISDGLEAVGVNITAVQASDLGFVTAWPAGIGPPGTSTLNYSPQQGNIANNAIVEVGVNGQICFFMSKATHLVVDVNNVFYDDAYVGVRPFRARDTRPERRPFAGSTTCTRVAGVGGIPSDAGSVVVNVAVLQADDRGYLSIYPKGTAEPDTSNLNYGPGENISNGNIIGVGEDGEICVFSSAAADHAIDVAGYFLAYEDVVSLTPPRRLFDSRTSTRRGAGATGCLNVVGSGVPVNATSVFLNVTAVRPSAGGFLTTYPKGQPRPDVSSLNYQPGGTRANGVMVPVGAGGRVCFFTEMETDLVVDLLAYEVFGGGTTVPGPSFDVGTVWLREDSGRIGACLGGYYREEFQGDIDWRNFITKWEFSSVVSLSAFNQRSFFQIEAYHRMLIREVCYESRYVYEYVGLTGHHLERCAAYTTALRLPPNDIWAFNWANGDWQEVRGTSNPCPANGRDSLTSDLPGALDGVPDPAAFTEGDPGVSATLRRLAGAGRQQTAVAIAEHAYPTGADVVYVAEEGSGLAEALAAGTITDGPVLLASGEGTPTSDVLRGVAELDPGSVVALGGPDSGISASVLEELAQGRPTQRVGGADIYATSADIARRSWPDGADTVYLAEGVNLADGLAGGTLTDGPILLVPANGEVPSIIAEAVEDLSAQRVVVLGGPVAVSDAVLADVARGRETDRLKGASRFETAAAVAQATFPDGAESVYLARADIAPDAVVAGSVTDGPILLVESCNGIHPATLAELERLQPQQIVALGGDAAICDDTLAAAQPG